MSQHEAHGSLKSYVIGYIASIILTIIPLLLVVNGTMSEGATIFIIMVAAILQFALQLIFFMHIKEGKDGHLNVIGIVLGVLIVFTIVAGSMWVMTFNSMVH